MTPASPEDRSKLHIAVLDPFFQRDDQPGSTRTYDLVRRLVHAGHRVTVFTTSAALPDSGVLPQGGFRWTTVQVRSRLRFGYPAADHVAKAFARGVAWRLWGLKDVDAVFAVDRPLGAMPSIIMFCALRGIPLVLEARDGVPPRAHPSETLGGRIAAGMARTVLRLTAAFARRVVVLSPDIKEALVAHKVRDQKITLSSPGCDAVLFMSPPGASTAALTAYPHLAQGTLVVYAGGMTSGRGLDQMLYLAAALQTTAPDVTFALCGDGPLRGKLEARAHDLGLLNKNVWFLDPLPRRDLPALLGAAAAVIVGGNDGTAGGALAFDALAASRPVILTASGWQRELIEGRGAGMGLPENDIPAAARELVDFLKDGDGLRRAGQQAAALAAGRFSMDRVAGEIRQLIEEAVAADPRQAVLRRRALRAKRAFDIVISATALVILSPVFLALAVAAQIKMGWPAFFTQTRTGLRGKLFRIVKFRTMTNAKDGAGNLLPDSERLTPFGRFMRRSSLDELPELWNVLKGDMSLVGPRPLLPEYLPYYTPEQRRRHDVAPGLTGWSQVNGRNALTWEDKFALDTWYVDNLSLWLDLKILMKTLWIAVSGKGISAEGHATMPRFDEIMARRQGAEDV